MPLLYSSCAANKSVYLIMKDWQKVGVGGGLCCCSNLQFVCAELIEHLYLEEEQKVILLTSLV